MSAAENTHLLAVPAQRDEVAEVRGTIHAPGSPTVQRSRELFRRASDAIRTRPQKRISAKKDATLNPIAKFRRYGRFPCKLVLNVVCFTLLFAIIIMCHVHTSQSEEAQRQTLIQRFMPQSYLDPSTNYIRRPTKYFGTVEDLRDFLEKTTKTYYSLVQTAAGHYDYWYTPVPGASNRSANATAANVAPLVLKAQLRHSSGRLSAQGQRLVSREVVLTTERPFGLFDLVSQDIQNKLPKQLHYWEACAPRREFVDWQDGGGTRWYGPCRREAMDNSIFDVVSTLSISVRVRSVDHNDQYTRTLTEYDWDIEQLYDFNPNGLITIEMDAVSTMTRHAESVTPWMWCTVALILFTIWDVVLRMRAFVKIRSLKAKREAEKRAQSDSSSSSSTDDAERQAAERASKWKLDLRESMGQSWTIWALWADLLTLAFALDLLFGAWLYAQTAWHRYTFNLIGGIAIGSSSTLFVSYLRFFPRLYVLFVSTNVAVPHLRRFLVAVLPIFTAFALYGVIMFGSYAPEFGTFFESCTALYAAIFGDSLLQMFQVTGAIDNDVIQQLGWLYSAAFISFFIYAVLNIATAIVLGSYQYVNERFSVYTDQVGRRVAMQKTRQEQLEEAIEKADEALRTVAAIMDDDRVLVRRSPEVGASAPDAPVPIIQVDPDLYPGDDEGASDVVESSAHSRAVGSHRPPLGRADASYTSQALSYTSHGRVPHDANGSDASGSSDSRRHRRRRHRGSSEMNRGEFFTEEWVDRDVIF